MKKLGRRQGGNAISPFLVISLCTRRLFSRPLAPPSGTEETEETPLNGFFLFSPLLYPTGMWLMQKWKKSGSLHQLALKDATDIRRTFMYRLSQRSNLHLFRNVLLAGSTQDRYVPWHSARVEMCRAAARDASVTGAAYREMVDNVLGPVVARPEVTLARFDVHHALQSGSTNAIIGRAAHIAVLDSELFIEKFLIISVLKYFQ